MKRVPDQLTDLLEPAIAALGYELVGIEYRRQPKNNLLRVYIDQDSGITLEDCEQVSHQLSGVLDVEDPIKGHYTLEVSSPGLDRPLFKAEHFERFAGNKVRVRTGAPHQGRRNWTGVLRGLEGDDVVVEVDGDEIRLPLDSIEQARLVPEY
ncbi:MAG: ribosome maturation factor RimP [Gammaproteobacteria bacterium]